jgi:hypothetical protein
MSQWLARILLTGGLLGLVLGSWAGAQLRRGLDFGVPLAMPSGLAVDEEGRVYAGTAADRIHVYGADGRFVRGWYLDRDAGRVRLRVSGPGRIEVATERSGRLHVFDRDGQLLETAPDAGAFERLGPTHDRVAEGPGGARYEIEQGALLRTAPPPRTVLSPAVHAPLAWFPRAPVPALTAILTASTVAILSGVVLASRRRTASPASAR